MNAELTADSNALNWIIARAKFQGIQVSTLDSSVKWNWWIFEGVLPEKMVKEIRGFLTGNAVKVSDSFGTVVWNLNGIEINTVLPYGNFKASRIELVQYL